MWKDFKEFIMRGNVIDLAVAVIIGAAFGAIVTSFVNDIVMPLIGQALGKVNFTDFFISLNGVKYATLADAKAAGAATVNYGVFINTIINFLIIAFVIFIVIRRINRLKKAPAPTEPTTKDCPFCHTQIPIPATRCPNCTSELT
jgi:large conductance mechanosensitive channel